MLTVFELSHPNPAGGTDLIDNGGVEFEVPVKRNRQSCPEAKKRGMLWIHPVVAMPAETTAKHMLWLVPGGGLLRVADDCQSREDEREAAQNQRRAIHGRGF